VFGISAIVAFVVAFLSPAVKDGWTFGPFDTVISFSSLGNGAYPGVHHNMLSGDTVTEMASFNAFDWTAIHHLQFPLWNDLSLLGLNQFLNFQSAVLSLPDLVSYLVPIRFAFLVVVAMKLLIAGTGAYVLCRVLGLKPFSASFGGIIFMLSGTLSALLAWPLSGVVVWLGWIAALAILTYRWRSKRSYLVLLAVSIAFCVYAGFPEAYFYVAVALLTFFAVLVVLAAAARRRFSLVGVMRVVVGVVAGGVLSSPLWFAGLEVVSSSHRAVGGHFYGVNPGSLGLLVAPGYYGLPIKGSTTFYSQGDYYETVVYVGVIALVLAGAAVLRWWRHPTVIALVVLVAVTLVISYQVNSLPIGYDLLRHTIFNSVAIKRMRIVLGLPVGVLAALGLETLVRIRRDRRMLAAYWGACAIAAGFVGVLWYHALEYRLPTVLHNLRIESLWWPTGLVAACLIAGILLAIGYGFAHRPAARRLGIMAGVVLFGAETAFLVFAGVGINSYSRSFYPVTPAIRELKSVVGSGLVGFDTGRPRDQQYLVHAGFYPEVNLGYGIAEYAGYDPLIPQAYFGALHGRSHIQPDIDSAAVARRYGIAWILQAPDSPLPTPPGTVYVGSFASERLYSVPGAARFSLVADNRSRKAGTVSSITHAVTSSWAFAINASSPSHLVIRVTDFSGWHASINGHPLALSAYEGFMMEAAVPAGHYVIHLWYLPERLVIGAWLALGTFVMLLAWAIWPMLWRRRRTESVRAELGESFAPALDAAVLACEKHTL
jgi:hypothetical protein